MTAERPVIIERGPGQEDLVITAQTLYNDNHSQQAEEARERWSELKLKGKLRGFVRCSDAREKIVGEGVSLGNISAASVPSSRILNDRGLESLTVLSHFDGETVEPGKMPTGCGGLAAKGTIGDTPQVEGIGKYVSEEIFSEDAVVQSLVTAERIARIADGKPVLAGVQDHLDYTIYPVAYFQSERGQMRSVNSVRYEDIFKYNPARIFENGVPTIDESFLPQELLEVLEQNAREARGILEKYPDLAKLNKVHRPRMVLLSTDIRSARVKYPTLTMPPGSVFKIHLPRERMGEELTVSDRDIPQALSQLEYPIKHSYDNHGDPQKPFSNTDRLIFEAPGMDQSRKLVKEAMKMSWLQNWISLPNKRILVAQVNAGIVNDIEEIAA